MLNKIKIILLFIFFTNFASSSFANEIKYLNNFQITSNKNFLKDFQAINEDGTYNAVIEVPSGTSSKWEVSKNGQIIELELNNGLPRVIDYLGYPSNYGFIPRTILPSLIGGDDDPLDILVLSKYPIPRGSVVKVNVIGMIKILDNQEIDNKIISLIEGNDFSNVNSLNDLKKKYPGILEIIEIWFKNYKGINADLLGTANKKETKEFINNSINNFNKYN